MSARSNSRHVDILFAREHGRQGARAMRAALEALDAGGTPRARSPSKCGVVVGVAGREPERRARRDLAC